MSPGDTLSLPFSDDFSYPDIYPKSAYWIDSNVFVNRDFPVAPVTLGVATFDGVSKSGCPYDTVSTNFTPLRCDSLTSKPIDLSYQQTDGVYLSFYYQAQGRGEEPETGDSLLLQFRSPVAGWTTVWGADGYSLTSGDTSFRRVMLPITDTTWLKSGFQFRFLNLGSRQGNVDMWHLDYVYLNDQRSAADTLLKDISFVYSANSFLTKYKSMPWNQYITTEMTASVYNLIRNNDSVMKNTTYEYRVYDQTMTQINTTYSGAGNINPFLTAGYTNCTVPSPCPNILQPNVSTSPANFNFPSMSDNTTYTIEHRITASPNLIAANDTLRYRQVFSNYYAYDDGTAEHAYGLSVIGAKLAYKFTLNQADTIRAVDMYFNWMPNGLTNPPSNSVTQRAFRITIWNDQNGQPNSIVYQDSVVTPGYHYEEHNDWGNLSNHFYRYSLTSPVLLSGTFYVGWVQYTDDLLNIGFDENTNNSSKIFYNTSGSWTNTTFSGSLMIRPVFGTPAEAAAGESEISTDGGIRVYPNPSTGSVMFDFSGSEEYSVRLADISGRMLRCGTLRSGQSWDVSDLANGVYLLLFNNSAGQHSTIRLILQK
ncbi:MAG: T9SS type A sorting domain-containing protein [Bacteroidia bacterium]|nr:T9SS type A sorting domain-containing protein [Bacteroidia bacterium]